MHSTLAQGSRPVTFDAVFYDGKTALPRAVSVGVIDASLEIREANGDALHWPLSQIGRSEAPPHILRLTCESISPMARLDVTDEAGQAEVHEHCPGLARRGHDERTGRIVLWSFAAAASLIFCVVFLVPLVAERLTPLIPYSLERRLGKAVDNQMRLIFDEAECRDPAGRASLDKMIGRLGQPRMEELSTEVIVIASEVENAFALPGGRIYLFKGLLDKAEAPDEVAGVLGHERGHVAQRDGLRKLIQTGGTSFLLGLLFGDVTGGGTIVLVSRLMIDNAYSRDAERAADHFSAQAMITSGRSPSAMARLLMRVTQEKKSKIPSFLSTHPVTAERLKALEQLEPSQLKSPLLSDEEWRALKGICKMT